jgi:Ni,Fe-hydrogenase III small subunit
MASPLRKTWEATPEPRLVVGVGECARTCGVFAGSYAVAGSVADIVPVDAWVDGCPPEPADILRGILAALDRLPSAGRRAVRGTGPAPGSMPGASESDR